VLRPLAITNLRRLALSNILFLPQAVVQIRDAAIENKIARRDAHIGAGQARMLPIDIACT